jgi:hypothetical protein
MTSTLFDTIQTATICNAVRYMGLERSHGTDNDIIMTFRLNTHMLPEALMRNPEKIRDAIGKIVMDNVGIPKGGKWDPDIGVLAFYFDQSETDKINTNWPAITHAIKGLATQHIRN